MTRVAIFDEEGCYPTIMNHETRLVPKVYSRSLVVTEVPDDVVEKYQEHMQQSLWWEDTLDKFRRKIVDEGNSR